MGGKDWIRNCVLGLLASAALCVAQEADSANGDQPSPAPQSNPHSQAIASAEGTQARPLAAAESPLRNSLSLFFALDEGEIEHGVENENSSANPVSHMWQQSLCFDLTNDAVYKERLRLVVSMECHLSFSAMQLNNFPATLSPDFSFYPNDVELSYAIGGSPARPWLNVAAGYFPFKYNPDAKHLGEYLLRCSAYPTFIVTNNEFPMTRELGFHVFGNSDWLINPAIDRIKWDLMLTSETHDWPTQDWTVTGILSNNLFNFFDIGAGVSFQRIIPINDTITTPRGKAVFTSGHITSNFLNANGDTTYFTFKSTKIMGRASIYPQRFIPQFRIPFAPVFGDKPFFGTEDLKIYGEAAILGLDNQTVYFDSVIAPGDTVLMKAPEANQYYDSLVDRIPYMVGINLPTNPLLSYGILAWVLGKWLQDETGDGITNMRFGSANIPLGVLTIPVALACGPLQHYCGVDLSLDQISLEFEHYSNRFPNSDYNAINFIPAGLIPTPRATVFVKNPSDIKYALTFKKSFADQRFAVSGLIGRDHMRPPFLGPAAQGDCDDELQARNQWWWTLRLSANF